MTDAPEYLRAGEIARLIGSLAEDGAALDCRGDPAVGEAARRAVGAEEGARTSALARAVGLGRTRRRNQAKQAN